MFAAARSRTFSDLAEAIDDALARWDRSHLQEFTIAGRSTLVASTSRVPSKGPGTSRCWEHADGRA
jgi:hypothetical protein